MTTAGGDSKSASTVRILGTISAARVSDVKADGSPKQLALQIGGSAGSPITSPGVTTTTACPASTYDIANSHSFGAGATCFTDSTQAGIIFVNLGSSPSIVVGE